MLMTEWDWDDAKEVWQAEAREEGIEQGLKQGLERGREEIARNLKNMGLPVEQIIQASGLLPEVVEKL